METQKLQHLYHALQTLGQNDGNRNALTKQLKTIEQTLDLSSQNIREEITGPILDALYSGTGVLQKRLSTGEVFNFRYTSKIARDLIMSQPDEPDHVWEPQTTKLLLYLSQSVKHVIVGGAYIGDHAILIANQILAREGICYAFEPDSQNRELLTQNSRLNNLNNIQIHPFGLWDNNHQQIQIVGEDAYASTDIISTSDNVQEDSLVKTITIDSFARAQEITNKIGLIMLDIEGSEHKALVGAHEHLSLPTKQAPNLVFEVHRHYVDWSNGLHNTDIIKYLSDLGYHLYSIRDFHSNYAMDNKPIELIPPEATYLEGPAHGFNMVGVKDPRLLQNNRFKICRDVSPKLLLHKDPTLHHPLDGLP